MTATLAPARPATEPAAARTLRPDLLAALLVLAAALALRLIRIRQADNIFVDEITYARIGDNLAHGHGLTLFGAPFNLHPPVGFALLAGAVRLLGIDAGQPIDRTLLALRPVAAVCGALVVLGALLAARLAGAPLRVAVPAAAALALDPFQISFDSRVMLEPFAQLFAVATVVLLLAGRRAAGRRARACVLGAGVTAGLVFATKETFGLVLAALLLLLITLPRVLGRRDPATVLGVGVLTYAVSVSGMWIAYGVGAWWRVKTSGLRRLVGAEQVTGFNSEHPSVSFVSRLAANLDQFGLTYLVLLAGGIATLVDLARHRPLRGRRGTPIDAGGTLISLWSLCACGYLVYAIVFGSLEEQMFYIALAPCVLRLGLSVAAWRRRPGHAARRTTAVLAAGAVLLTGQAAVWTRVHTRDADLFSRFLAWQRATVPAGTRIGVTDDPTSFLVQDAVVGTWTTVRELRAHDARYVVVDRMLVEQGYSPMTPQTLDYLRAHTEVAYRATSDQDTLYVFDLRRL